MNKIKPYLPILIIVLLSFILRLALLSKGPYNLDSFQLALIAQDSLDNLRYNFLHGTGYPLTVLFGSAFIFLTRLFGVTDPVISVNFMCVFFSTPGRPGWRGWLSTSHPRRATQPRVSEDGHPWHTLTWEL